MFHVKHPARLLVVALALLAVVGVGCTGVSKPKGWSAPVDGGDGIVLMHDQRGTISAVRLTDSGSAVLWTFPGDKDKEPSYKSFYATPIVDRSGPEPRVIVVSYSGHVISLKLKDGTRTDGWPAKVEVKGSVVATPALVNGILYVASEHRIVPVNAVTGVVSAPILKTSDKIWAAPVFVDGTLYVASLDGKVHAISPDGTERWQHDLGGAIAGDIAVDAGVVYAGTLKSELVALDAATGEERWAFEGADWFWARPLIVNKDTIVVSTTLGTVYAIDRATGEQKWQRKAAAGDVHTTPALVGTALVIADSKGNVYGLDATTGDIAWRQQQAGEQFFADPLVLESGIFYLSEDGTLVRVRPQEQGALSVVYQRG